MVRISGVWILDEWVFAFAQSELSNLTLLEKEIW